MTTEPTAPESLPAPPATLLEPTHLHPLGADARQEEYPDDFPDERPTEPWQYTTLYAAGDTSSLAAIAGYVLCVARRCEVGEAARGGPAGGYRGPRSRAGGVLRRLKTAPGRDPRRGAQGP